MNSNLKYHEILEEDLVVEIEWLKEEFEILFKSKIKKHSKMDKKIAHDLLIYILENIDVHENFLLLNLLEDATNIIENVYRPLFN
ncbi:MAG: hypothetical protein ACXAC5_21655 [Promethearchaeota archaeon]|jgi:hypothetical protein